MRNLLLLLTILIGLNGLANSRLDSLWSVWQDQSIEDTVRLEALKVYGWEKYLYVYPDSTFYYAQMQYDYAKSKGLKKQMASALNSQGVSHYIKGENDLAVEFYNRSLKLQEEIGNTNGVASSYSNIAMIYSDQGNYAKAIDYNFKSLEVMERLKDSTKMGQLYNNIGVLYDYQKMFELAITYHEKSLDIKTALKNQIEIISSLTNIGAAYAGLEQYDKALDYYERAEHLSNVNNHKQGLGIISSNKGSILREQQRYDEALKNYDKALAIYQELEDVVNIMSVHNHLGIVYQQMGDNKKAEQFSLKALETAKKLERIEVWYAAAENLSNIYADQGNYQKAFEYIIESYVLRDSIRSEENKNAVIEMNYKYDYEKQALLDSIDFAKKDELKSLEIKEQQAQLDKEQTQRYALYGGIGLLLILGFTLLRSYRRKRDDNVLIKSQHQALQESHIAITDSIDYAKRLQDAILPSFEELSNQLAEYFVLFKPKDVVSGDFYWFENNATTNTKLFAVADCTGHGVPGAMVSLVCSSALNRAVKEFGLTEPEQILNKARKIVIETFAKSGKGIRDGMDISLCSLSGNKLTYVGAHNPIWLIRRLEEFNENDFSGETHLKTNHLALIEFKANKQPVGLYENMVDFKQTEIKLVKGDVFYLFTDGYADQFGGENDKKFKKKALKKLLIEINDMAMPDQQVAIEEKFNAWKKGREQVDDICIMGVRI